MHFPRLMHPILKAEHPVAEAFSATMPVSAQSEMGLAAVTRSTPLGTSIETIKGNCSESPMPPIDNAIFSAG